MLSTIFGGINDAGSSTGVLGVMPLAANRHRPSAPFLRHVRWIWHKQGHGNGRKAGVAEPARVRLGLRADSWQGGHVRPLGIRERLALCSASAWLEQGLAQSRRQGRGGVLAATRWEHWGALREVRALRRKHASVSYLGRRR